MLDADWLKMLNTFMSHDRETQHIIWEMGPSSTDVHVIYVLLINTATCIYIETASSKHFPISLDPNLNHVRIAVMLK